MNRNTGIGLSLVLALTMGQGSLRGEPGVCTEEKLNSWALGCAWAVRAVRIAELPPSEDVWKRLSPPFFETRGDLVSEWLAACHETVADPDRVPDSSRELLRRLNWPESGADCSREEELEWLQACHEDAESMRLRTRRDLYSRFDSEGGISTPSQRTFIHRRCRMLKVEVKFESSSGSMPESESLDDVVIEIAPEIGVFFPG